MHVGPRAAFVRQESPADQALCVPDAHRVFGRIDPVDAEVRRQVLAFPHREADVVKLAGVRERDDGVDVVDRDRARRQPGGELSGAVHPGHCIGATGPGELHRRLERAPHVVEVVPRHERHAVRLAVADQVELRERDIGVERAVSVGLSLADERDRPALAVAQHGLHLARAATDARRVGVHEPQTVGPIVQPPLLVRDDGDVTQAGRLQHRFDVEREPVGDDRDVEVVRLAPADEPRERGVELAVRERERHQRVAVGVEHPVLCLDRLAQADLPAIERVVVGGPRRIAERDQQLLRDVDHGRRSVEVDQHGSDRQHRRRLPATLRAWTTSANGSRSDSRKPNGSAALTCRAPRCWRSTGSSWRSRTSPTPRSTRRS